MVRKLFKIVFHGLNPFLSHHLWWSKQSLHRRLMDFPRSNNEGGSCKCLRNSLEVAPGTTLNDLMCPYSSKPMVGAMVARCLRSNTIGSDLPQNQATKTFHDHLPLEFWAQSSTGSRRPWPPPKLVWAPGINASPTPDVQGWHLSCLGMRRATSGLSGH